MTRRLFRVARIGISILIANRPRLVILAAGSASVALAASSILMAASTSRAMVQQTIEAGWRGTYDILVRPSDAPTFQLVDGTSVVPASFGTSPTTGISRRQWEQIAAIPGVDVAAPIASLGWMRRDDVGISIDLGRLRPGATYHVQTVAKIGEQDASAAEGYVVAADRPGEAPFVLGVDAGSADGALSVQAGFLPSSWGLVVGIDPPSEDQLVGLAGEVDGSYLGRGVGSGYDPIFRREAVVVPVLTTRTARYPGTLSVSVTELPPDAGELLRVAVDDRLDEARLTGAYPDLEETLRIAAAAVSGTPEKAVLDAEAPLSELIAPLADTPVQVSAQGLIRPSPDGGLRSAVGRNALLVPGTTGYAADGDRFRLEPTGSWSEDLQPRLDALQPPEFRVSESTFGGDDSIFRPLEVTAPPAFLVELVGSYDLAAMSASNLAANYVPLGTYEDVPRRLVRDAAGNPTDLVLPVSQNPGGLNPLAPVGLTNLEAVEALRGARFIDAVRVRVAGIDGYSEVGIQKLEDIAQAIVDRTGLHVDVVAGASPRDILVDVPGVGTMLERWTTLGTAPRIESAASGVSAVLLAAAMIAVVIYLIVFGLFLTAGQAAEAGTMRLVGWGRHQILVVLASQALAMGVLSAAGAVAIAWSVSLAFGGQLGIGGVLLLVLVVPVLHLVAAAGVGLVGSPVAASLRAPARRPGRRRGGVTGVAVAKATQSPRRLVIVAVALAVSAGLAGTLVLVIAGFDGRMQTSVFGALVALRVGPYHVMAAAAGLFAAAAVAVDATLLALERDASMLGLLRAVGWSRGNVARLTLWEAAIPATLGAVTSAALVLIVGLVLGLGPVAFIAAGGTAALALLVGSLAGIPAADIASSLPPAVSLRAEGTTGSIAGLTTRTALLAIGLLVVASTLGGAAWAVTAPAGIPPSAFVTPPPSIKPQETEIRIRADIDHIVAGGARSLDGPGLNLAAEYVTSELSRVGYVVNRVKFAVRQIDVADEQGVPIELDTVASSAFPIALAYDPAGLSQPIISGDLTLIDARDGMGPVDECPEGILYLRVRGDMQAWLSTEVQQRCLGVTAAVLTVHVENDSDWEALVAHARRAAFVVQEHLVAETPETGVDGVPWLIAPLSSTGPGATQSGAPVALALEIARRAAAEGVPLRIAFAVGDQGASASAMTRYLHQSGADRVIVLGPLGGRVPVSVGTTRIAATTDPASIRAGLLSTVAIDKAVDEWIDATSDPTIEPTPERLTEQLAAAVGRDASAALGANAYLLAVGIPAAYVGEASPSTEGTASVAGTPADRAPGVDVASVARLVTPLLTVLAGSP